MTPIYANEVRYLVGVEMTCGMMIDVGRILDFFLRRHRVELARELPEEAKVKMLQALRRFFEASVSQRNQVVSRILYQGRLRRAWSQLSMRLRNFLWADAVVWP